MIHFYSLIFILLVIISNVGVYSQDTTYSQHKNILIINSYHYGYEGSDALVEEAKYLIKEHDPFAQIYVEYMDTKRYTYQQVEESFLHTLKTKYYDKNIDAVMVSDDNAFQFMLSHSSELVGDTPIVFCGVNHFTDSMLDNHPNYKGVLETLDFEATIDLALTLHPQTKQLFVVSDGTETGISQRSQIQSITGSYPQRTFQFINGEDYTQDELLQTMQSIPKDSIVLITVWTQDKSGKYFDYRHSYPLICSSTHNPVYGFDRLFLGFGIVGGKLNWGGTQGKAAAQILLDVMNYTQPNEIPSVNKESLNAWMFDYNQIKRFQINSKDLPNNSIIINEPDPFVRIDKSQFFLYAGFIGTVIIFLSVIAIILHHQKKTEQLKHVADRKYRFFIQNFHGIAYQINENSDRPIFVDGNVHGLLGYANTDFLEGRIRFDQIIHADDFDYVKTVWNNLQQNIKTVTSIEYRIRKKDGCIRWVHEVKHSIVNNGETSLGVQCVIYDIHDKKLLEEQLLHAQKLESIGTLAGGIAHDFNNILMAILGYSELLLDEYSHDASLCQSVADIKTSAEKAAKLTHQLLAYGRKQILKPQVTQFNELIHDIKSMLQRLIGENIEITLQLDPDLHTVYCDSVQIEQVLINLAVNARDAIPVVGKLLIETKNVYLDEHYAIHHPDVEPGHYVMLAFSDNGKGIPKENLNKIFDPFFTTKDIGKGTGLGLSTVQGIVKQSKGHIWVYSEIDQFTTFKIYFPSMMSSTVQDEMKIPSSVIKRGHETILVVEDNETIIKLIQTILTNNGYHVHLSQSGLEALDIAEQLNGQIDLLITDVVMPKMGGKELAERLQQKNGSMQILFMSGYTENAIVHHGVLDKNTAFIQKPFEIQKLLQIVRSLLDKKMDG